MHLLSIDPSDPITLIGVVAFIFACVFKLLNILIKHIIENKGVEATKNIDRIINVTQNELGLLRDAMKRIDNKLERIEKHQITIEKVIDKLEIDHELEKQ